MLVTVCCWLAIAVIAIVCIVSPYVIDLYDRLSVYCEALGNWGYYDMHDRNYMSHQKPLNHYYEAEDKIDTLIKELIRHRYCKEVLHNPMFTELAEDERRRSLFKLEALYPNLKKEYSPTQYSGFNREMAVRAFGWKTNHDWSIHERTLSLTAPSPEKPLVTIPIAEDYGY